MLISKQNNISFIILLKTLPIADLYCISRLIKQKNLSSKHLTSPYMKHTPQKYLLLIKVKTIEAVRKYVSCGKNQVKLPSDFLQNKRIVE